MATSVGVLALEDWKDRLQYGCVCKVCKAARRQVRSTGFTFSLCDGLRLRLVGVQDATWAWEMTRVDFVGLKKRFVDGSAVPVSFASAFRGLPPIQLDSEFCGSRGTVLVIEFTPGRVLCDSEFLAIC